MSGPLPLIPTTVCGSHGLPSWLHLVREAAAADRLGPIDLQEAYEDAVRLAMQDQVEAGVDVISDGEMPSSVVSMTGWKASGRSPYPEGWARPTTTVTARTRWWIG